MNGLTAFLEKYFVPVAAKIGSQKHLVALRDAFISTMPITMAGWIRRYACTDYRITNVLETSGCTNSCEIVSCTRYI